MGWARLPPPGWQGSIPLHDARRGVGSKDVLLRALAQTQAERGACLERTCCDDPELGREVESLLASDAAAATFCETPAAGLLGRELGLAAPPRLQTGARLGVYEIVE